MTGYFLVVMTSLYNYFLSTVFKGFPSRFGGIEKTSFDVKYSSVAKGYVSYRS